MNNISSFKDLVLILESPIILALVLSLLLFFVYPSMIRSRRESREFDMKMRTEANELEFRRSQQEFEQVKAQEDAAFQRLRFEREFPTPNDKLKESESSSPDSTNSHSTDFFYVSVDEKVKHTFSDMLKGFEKYARLLGYEVSLSIDSSTPELVGYKFSLSPDGKYHSNKDIQEDIDQYWKAMTADGKSFTAPQNSSPEHSQSASATMQTLKVLKRQMNDLKLQQEAFKMFCESLGEAFTANQPQIFITQQQLLGNDMTQDNRSYSADGSSNVIQGDQSGNHISDSNIQIGKNVNQKNEQAEALLAAISALKAENKPELATAIRQFENAHEEVTEEEKPDSSRLERFFAKGSEAIKQVGVLADTTSKVNKALELFSAVPLG
ncbi:hypothetical protein FCV53_02525 [Vibrio sp. F12]|uniref:hypothetical protein n=1 Tax=Vibrio sp. F12 TaxID=2070776 RepID=UPI0010BD5ED3|nr:hypothetical protein [Vibrio sp. F12]TKE94352.1 hypothetical protein FCV53_02525 [Vibrio sp. F12]